MIYYALFDIKRTATTVTALSHSLVIFTFSCSFGFLLPLYAGFLVMLSLTNLLLNSSLCAVSFESA